MLYMENISYNFVPPLPCWVLQINWGGSILLCRGEAIPMFPNHVDISTWIHPPRKLKKGSPKEEPFKKESIYRIYIVFQPSFFRGYLSFRGDIFCNDGPMQKTRFCRAMFFRVGLCRAPEHRMIFWSANAGFFVNWHQQIRRLSDMVV